MPDIREIMEQAKAHGASDVHITVGIPPKMRINGELVSMDFERFLPADTLVLLDQIMDSVQREKYEEQGELDMSFAIRDLGRYRVNCFKQRGSAAMALRLVATEIPEPRVLGIPDTVMDLCDNKKGLVLVTGPTGSGKSTTLAAMIDRINRTRNAHVITLEDPIEYLHKHDKSIVNQREIGLDSRNYANALRAALREDPDVLLVGEMRDFETISVALTAAETGHLVLSTLHTIGCSNTVDRIIDVFPPHQQQQIRVQLAGVLEAVVCQQLIPTVDNKSRVAAFEVMHANPAVRNLVREGKSHQLMTVMQTNRKLGMITMDEAIMQLHAEGKITKEMALQFAQEPEVMSNKLRVGLH